MRSILLVLLLSAASPAMAGPLVPRDQRPTNVTTIISRDVEGNLKPCRLEVTDVLMDAPIPPKGSDRFYTAYSGHNYVHSHGVLQVAIENSVIQINASSGFEFEPQWRSLWVGENDTVNIVLERVYDLREQGWYSGDMHLHIDHAGAGDVFTLDPFDMYTIAKAEDLAFSSVLSNGLFFTGDVDPVSDADHLIYFGLEFRSGIYGHMDVLGMPAIEASGCCTPEESPPYPSNSETALAYKAAGATFVLAHPATTNLWDYNTVESLWPFSGFARELPALVINHAVDAIDVFSYSNVSLDLPAALWFDVLDLGLKLPLSAGTDAAANRCFDPPAGGYRVYVNLDEPFTMDTWLKEFRAGRSFATNGPLPVHFSLEGVEPGGKIAANRGIPVKGAFRIHSLDALETVELISNGSQVIASFEAPSGIAPGPNTWEHSFDLLLPEGTSWVVLRAIVSKPGFHVIGNNAEAYTSPIYVKGMGDNERAEMFAATQYVNWIDDLKQIAINLNSGFEPDGIAPLLTNFAAVRDKLLDIKRWEERKPDIQQQARSRDQFSRGEPFLFSAFGTGMGLVEVFDLQGRLISRLPKRELPARWSWRADGVATGVYFARVITSQGSTVRRLVVLP